MGDNPKNLDELWTARDGPIARRVTAVVVGAGNRGENYASFATDFPSRMKIVAVAEPLEIRRAKFQEKFGLDDDFVFSDWRELATREKMADVAIVTTQDQMHREPAVALAGKGYHLLLEKPMSVSEEECEDIARACQENDTIVAVCHVLRYFPPAVKIREIVESGALGEVVVINHTESILFWHFAHSFVRGNWRNEGESSCSLLAKCCHDIDLIMFWMGDMKCTKIQSFGGLYHFRKEQKPKGAASRCLECPVEKDCAYSAQKIYLERNRGHRHWPMSAVCDIEDHPKGYKAALRESLESGPYGRCVYECDNDVCDHQTVNMEFESGATANMTMNAFTENMTRWTRICGTKGELRWDGSARNAIEVHDFATGEKRLVYPDSTAPDGVKCGGHDGADFFLVNAFTKAVASGDRSLIASGIVDSLRSHKLVFAAEGSRLESCIKSVQI